MSYDLMVFEPNAAPRERKDFLDWFQSQTQWSEDHSYDDPSETTMSLSAWYAEMRRDFPNMHGPNAYEIANDEDNARVTGYSIGRSIIYTDFRWSEAESAYAIVRKLAVKHNVGFFNVSAEDGEIWFPPTEQIRDTRVFSGLTLTIEGQQPFKAPSVALIEAAIDWLQPLGGPGFLLLERNGGGNYAQVGGGKDACTAEWRECFKGDFRHGVAGLPSLDRKTSIKIPGNRSHFTIRANERLSNENAKAILLTFAHGKSRPQEFVWRDITAELSDKIPQSSSKPWWQFWC